MSLTKPIRKKIQNYSYDLTSIIGKGFSSTVFKGTNDYTLREVAIKVINMQSIRDDNLKQLLYSEIAILKRLNHPNIVKCEAVYFTPNNCYIITEFCNEGDLSSYIVKKKPRNEEEIINIMTQLAQGLNYLQQMQLIHRDIKPANILISDGVIKIADFGFSLQAKNQNYIKCNYNVGSPLYMSPLALLENTYSFSSDLWALGVLFHQLNEKRPPWVVNNKNQLKQRFRQRTQMQFILTKNVEIIEIIVGCLKHDEKQRFNIQQVLDKLKKCNHKIEIHQHKSNYKPRVSMPVSQINKDIQIYSTIQTKHKISYEAYQPLKPFHPHHQRQRSHGQYCPQNIIPQQKLPPKPYKQKLISKEDSKENTNYALNQVPEEFAENHHRKSYNQQNIIKQNINQIHEPQNANRYNHTVLKAIINYCRLLYKVCPRIQSVSPRYLNHTNKQIVLSVICQTLKICISILYGIINKNEFERINKHPYISQNKMLKSTGPSSCGKINAPKNISEKQSKDIQNYKKEIEQLRGTLKQFESFATTQCYWKLIAVVGEYYDKYTAFISKIFKIANETSKTSIQHKIYKFNQNWKMSKRKDILKIIEGWSVQFSQQQHNLLGLDYLMSFMIYTDFISTYGLHQLYKQPNLETVVELPPQNLTKSSCELLQQKRQQFVQHYLSKFQQQD